MGWGRWSHPCEDKGHLAFYIGTQLPICWLSVGSRTEEAKMCWHSQADGPPQIIPVVRGQVVRKLRVETRCRDCERWAVEGVKIVWDGSLVWGIDGRDRWMKWEPSHSETTQKWRRNMQWCNNNEYRMRAGTSEQQSNGLSNRSPSSA